jgi:hypothetical protein
LQEEDRFSRNGLKGEAAVVPTSVAIANAAIDAKRIALIKGMRGRTKTFL